ncbi:MAG: hypothetical protein LBE02_05865 [Spirochaetaceae bacterium]|jgi:hypothetical protein|nr:hypothetical protein [Spirochaetaceae bacterium]
MSGKKIILFLGLLALANPFRAVSDSREKEPPEESVGGISSDRVINLTVSSIPEAKISFVQGFTFPVFRGESVLTADNNIRTTLSAEVSPVSADGVVEGILTPVAFLQVAAGFRIGSGWNIRLFGGELYGIGINRAGAGGKAEASGSAFDGVQWKAHFGGALQFDLAAVFPGPWRHVVFRSYHEINYKAYSAASKNDSWFFENDEGENKNGFTYYGNFLIGYQMPLFLNTAAILVEMNKFLDNTPNRDLWGGDLVFWTLSAVFNFTITRRLDAALISQFRTLRNYTNSEDLFYQDRILDKADPRGLKFYRIAVILSFKLP